MKIIHRDLKPENVLVSEEGRAVLCDFETSKLEAGPSVLGTLTTVVLSGVYTAPDVRSGGVHGQASDMYSFGVMSAQALAGNLVADPQTLLTPAHFSDPQELQLLKRLLHPDPAQRPSAGQLLLEPLFRERMLSCCICKDTFPYSRGLECQGTTTHFMCGDCFSDFVADFSASDIRTLQIKKGKVRCSPPPPPGVRCHPASFCPSCSRNSLCTPLRC